MAEVKNSFLKSRMNQDLDDRLVPNGEYRYANNISVGRSEADDIGALQNILGNELLALTDNSEFIPNTNTPNPNYIPGLECIGFFMDNQNNRIFQFLTDYTDPDPNNITLPTTGNMKITMYNFDSSVTYVTLVEGLFLNFAKNKEFRITGVNLIEGLLFWTDNRNQPRKINVSNASNPNYYTTEEQISVAKYAPVEPITLYRKVTTRAAEGRSSATTINVDDATGIVPGMTLITSEVSGADFCVVTYVTPDPLPDPQTITFYEELPPSVVEGTELTFLISTMTDKSSIPSWPGDPAFLEDKYVRFSYRFKYDDNEYSLMAPFTQIAYIPKQKGYFIAGNEIDAYRSTIINWFENNINNIELIVPFPDRIGNLVQSYKIKEIDILYKESDSIAVKVFETIPISAINTPTNTDNNYYVQPYQSQKPYRTLPDDQSTRVYDKVPVRAKAQESAGNRIIYGNYYDKYTCPSSINYNISIQPKSTMGTNFIEYPNHTLKKNRNYQVGFVLADKFGRQSPVVLSSVDLEAPFIDGVYTKGSTVYSSYENSILFEDVRTWFGDALILYLNAPIDQQKDLSAGKPGLYAIPTSSLGFAITAVTEIATNEYTFTMDLTALASNYVPEVGNILRGKYIDYVEVLTSVITYQTPGDPLTPIVSVTITTSDSIGDIYNYNDPGMGVADIKFAYIYNPIGWYSYKIVVKQQEQDYYNVYLPGMLNGYPKNQTSGSQVVYTGVASTPALENGINITQFPVSETGNTSHIVLINDNINKVPRDLTEVGPDQKQYRSSVQLYGRVENTEDTITIIGDVPAYSAKVIKIYYDTATVGNEDWALIKPGDGIQCEEANTPIDNPDPLLGGTVPNPYRWLGDTVVVSNVVVGTAGIITISSPNWVLTSAQDPNGEDYITFIITRAENRQYFPTRKADTVIAIATANEFNFLDNSVDNLSGTAALNFYQLQNSPLIGRISTNNKIGVAGEDMIPFLSVYETRPEQTILELFWETATTGLISDLNADVLTGFDGPASFSDPNYTHFEFQDPYGGGEGTGAENSKYITDEFTVLDPNGIILSDTTVTLLSVFDGTGQSRLADFNIEASNDGTNDVYRLYIKKPSEGAGNFVFNYNASTLESYLFTFNVVDNANLSTATTLTISGRLGNNDPIITTDVYDYNINQATTDIVNLEADNGSYSNAITGLTWRILSGNTTPPSFAINYTSGELTLINPEIPLGQYELEIEVQDASKPRTGAPTLPSNTIYGSLYDTITLTINVGNDPVPIWLRPLFGPGTDIIGGGIGCSPEPYPYGMIYIGPTKNFGTGYSYLPEIDGSGKNYQIVYNVEVVNAANNGEPDILPTGLTIGEYRVKISLDVPPPFLCDEDGLPAASRSKFEIYLYKRVYAATNSNDIGWGLTKTQNNKETEYELPQLVVTSTVPQEKIITTSFTIKAEAIGDSFYEWAVGVKMINNFTNVADAFPFVSFAGEDANYSYDQITPDFNAPILISYPYYTGVRELAVPPESGITSAIPYDDQNAIRGISYLSPFLANPITSGNIIMGDLIVNLTLTNINNQVTQGLFATIKNSAGTIVGQGWIVNVDEIDRKNLTIQLLNSPGSGVDLAAGKLQLETQGSNDDIGVLYANTAEGTEVKRFYTDAEFTQKWIPPVAGKFYNFITVKDYDPDGAEIYTQHPYYCAQFNSDGEVIEQTDLDEPNSQTAWQGWNTPNTAVLPIANYNYNIYYEEP